MARGSSNLKNRKKSRMSRPRSEVKRLFGG